VLKIFKAAGALGLALLPAGQAAADQVRVDNASAEVRRYQGEVRRIQGLDTALGGAGRALVATVSNLDKAIKDLGAKITEHEILVDLSADVLFNFDKWDIKPEAETELNKLAVIIRKKRKGDVWIYGHTDAKGSDAYNQRLSERRAESVKAWLVEHGKIPAEVLKTRGDGERRPVAPNTKADGSDDPEGRAKNRRVETIIKTGS